MDRLQSLEVFVAVAETGSFAEGARKIGLSAPSVTRGVNALEARLGARLFTRTTRRVNLTEIGQSYLEDVRLALSQLRGADNAAAGLASNPIGRLRITCPNEFGRIYIMPILTDYLDQYPDVDADIVMVDRIVNIVDEGYDLAVRIGHLQSSGLMAIKVGQVRRMLCAAPSYIERHGKPSHPSELSQHKIIANAPASRTMEWRFDGDKPYTASFKPRLSVSSVAASISVAQSGWGICRVLSYQVGDDIQNGTLVPILEDFEPDPLPIQLVHVEGRSAPAKLRSFLDFASKRLRGNTLLNS